MPRGRELALDRARQRSSAVDGIPDEQPDSAREDDDVCADADRRELVLRLGAAARRGAYGPDPRQVALAVLRRAPWIATR